MKIVSLFGSPRQNGNSEAIARRIMNTAVQKGAETRAFYLHLLNYKGCYACMGCKRSSEKCVIKDDLAYVLEAVSEADVVILATPVYFGDMTGQMKCYFDRTYSFMTPDYLTNPTPTRLAPGKKCIFVQTQGSSSEDQFGDIFPKYDRFLKWQGFETILIRGVGLYTPQDAENNKELMQQAEEIAEKLMEGEAE